MKGRPRTRIVESRKSSATLRSCAAVAWLLVALGGCANLPSVRPEPPRVSVAGVRPLNLSLTEQRLEFRLRVANPNPYELPLRSLDFVARLAGEPVASGRSDERVTVPPHGEAIVTVDVSAGVDRLLGRMRSMLERRTLELDYDVSGSVRLDNWPRRIPFDVGGVLEDPRSRSAPDSAGAEAADAAGGAGAARGERR